MRTEGAFFAWAVVSASLSIAQEPDGYYTDAFTMAPMIYDDLILIGPAGSETAISGWVGAFRLGDGESVWRFKTVPGAREDWEDSWENPEDIVLGGGAVWTPFTCDPEREELGDQPGAGLPRRASSGRQPLHQLAHRPRCPAR